jgi:hypothetical protein
MGFLLPKIKMSAPAAPAPQAIAPETVAAQERQEQRIEAEEVKQQAQMASRTRARRGGGQRMLLSMYREEPRLGIPSNLDSYKGV